MPDLKYFHDYPLLFAFGCIIGQADMWYQQVPKIIRDMTVIIVVIAGQYYTVKSDIRDLATQIRYENAGRIACCSEVKRRVEFLNGLHSK